MPIFLDIFLKFIYRYRFEVDEVQIYKQLAWGLLVVLSARCGLAA
jgi:hypothetical protein